MRRRCLGGRAAAVAIALGSAARPAGALDPERALTQYVRDSWTVKHGAPAGTITGIAQTPDGYLWLGTEGEGLVRFDGVAFVHVGDLDALFGHRLDRVTSLISGRDGALWVGTSDGLARLRGGRWATFDRGEAKNVLGLHEARDGTVWYARHWEGVYRVSGDTVTHLPLAGKPRFLASDRGGTVWAGGYEGLWRLAGAERRLLSTRDGLPDANVSCILGDLEGDVWLGFRQGLVRLRDDKVVARYTAREGLSTDEVSAVFLDPAGTLWVGTTRGGVNRLRGERFESLTGTTGLNSDRVTALYQDREGSLWIGTSSGLSRLRDASLLPIGEAEGLSPGESSSIVEAADGAVYVSSGLGGLHRIEGRRILRSQAVPGSNYDGPLYADPDGGVWSGHQDGLSYRRGGRRARFPVVGLVQCIARDAKSLVFATTHGEVFRLVGGKPERFLLEDGSWLGTGTFGIDFVWMMHGARDGTFWLGTSRGAIAVRDGRARQVWHQGTLSARSIHEDEDGTLWFGTEAGVLRVSGASSAMVTTKQGLPQDVVYYVLSDRQGGLWMSGARGLFRVSRRNLEDAVLGRVAAVESETFGMAEGMRALDASSARLPTGCATRDGRLWFATTEGVVVADPSRMRRNTVPPPVLVEAVLADGRPLAPGSRLTVPAGTERLVIHYNGLSLLVPSRVRFRYKLEGYDRGWVDAEGRRVAHYTRLPPGDYRFRVVAANNDGVWNEAGASIDLRQRPLLHQTAAFRLAAALAAIGCVWGLYRLRLRRHARVEREMQARIKAALAQIKTLSGLLPICAWCKKVRDDTGYWSQIETFVKDHSHAEFSQGLCPDCAAKLAVAPADEARSAAASGLGAKE